MNLFVADAHWGWWIILYFFLGGIAAGAYFTATLIDLFGNARYQELARVGYWIAFPLIVVCGMLLTVDLERPERFWHMLFKSEIVHQARAEGWPTAGGAWKTFAQAFLFKYWSPMSLGAWALMLFGACSVLSCLGSIWPEGRLSRWFRHSVFARFLQLIGCSVGLFIASYTGALLTATNQPLWSDSNWIASLFMASAASTGVAAITLIAHSRHADVEPGLRRADLWAVFLELLLFTAFLVSLGPLLKPLLFTLHGKVFVIGTAVLGILLPLFLLSPLGKVASGRAVTAALLSLLGGLVLRYGILTTPPEMLEHANTLRSRFAHEIEAAKPFPDWPQLPPEFKFSPEDGRARGGGPGADPGNRSADFVPRSKVFNEP